MKKGIIFGRVSTSSQDYDRQVVQLSEFSKKNDIEIVEVFTETVSGSKKAANRKQLSSMLDYIKTHDIDIVLVWELSRLGRCAFDVQNTINEIVNVSSTDLYLYDLQMYAHDRNGLLNPFFKIVTDVLASVAQMERNQISQRTKAGLKHAKEVKGIKLGRRKGSTKPIEETRNFKKILSEVKKNEGNSKKLGVRKLAKICEVSPNTVLKIQRYYRASNNR